MKITMSAALGAALFLCNASARAEADISALAGQMKGVKVTLEQGLTASSSKGKPISGKFEVEDGKLQLSVYTAKGSDYSEVIVDHRTGKVAKAEPITGGDDLAAAKAQADAVSAAKTSLAAAVRKAVKENKGYRAVSVTPSTKDGHPSAEVMLIKGTDETKSVTEPID
jgi:hypothetical protein